MAIHVTNFGTLGRTLGRYTDHDGYVPEAGDALDALSFGADFDDAGDDAWEDFRAEAVAATERASAALDAWRNG